MKGKGQPSGAYWVWWFKLIFITQVPRVRVWESVCAFKPTKAWAEQKNAISGLSAWLPQHYEILKNLCFLPASAFLREKYRGSSSSTVPVHRGVLWRVERWGGVIPPVLHGGQHMPGHRPPLHTLKASKPPAFCANALSAGTVGNAWQKPAHIICLDKRDIGASHSTSFVPFVQLKALGNFNKSDVTPETFFFWGIFVYMY